MEANGFLVLILLVFLVAIVPRLYFQNYQAEFSSKDTNQSLEEWAAEMNASITKKKIGHTPLQPVPITQQSFDPNKASVDEMINGGLPGYLAKRIVKYREKGGGFDEVNDLKKMYGMTDSLFSKVKNYVVLSVATRRKDTISDATYREPHWTGTSEISFELNSATIEELQSINGIGPVLSERIVKYRDMLGGFHSTNQLKEVYGLKVEVINKVIERIDTLNPVEQIPINTDSIKSLTTHPYIDYNLARAIINYRQVHGPYKSLDELLKIKVMDDSLYQRLSPYLSL